MKQNKYRKRVEKKIKRIVAPLLISLIIRSLYFTLRITEHNPENVRQLWLNGTNVIVAFWHGRLLMIPMLYKRYKERHAYGLASHHNDGEIVSRFVRIFGYDTIRGSTGKGKGGLSALRKMIRALQNSSDLVLAPDGPSGPRHKVQRGIINLARLSGSPIIPLAFSSSKGKILKTWDAFLLPLPFSRGVFVWGEPLYIENKNDKDYLEAQQRLLEERLTSTTNMADNYFKKTEYVYTL